MRRSGDALSAMDWDTVKAEDKILVYQVGLVDLLLPVDWTCTGPCCQGPLLSKALQPVK